MREAGDAEAQMPDPEFVEALEYGMPPACGFGLSERVFAFFMDKKRPGVPDLPAAAPPGPRRGLTRPSAVDPAASRSSYQRVGQDATMAGQAAGPAARSRGTDMKTADTWKHIHSERARWRTPGPPCHPASGAAASWCEGWSVRTPRATSWPPPSRPRRTSTRSWPRRDSGSTSSPTGGPGAWAPPARMSWPGACAPGPSTTNHPPAPVMAMLGEILVHGEDIRRPPGPGTPAAGGGPGRRRRQLEELQPADSGRNGGSPACGCGPPTPSGPTATARRSPVRCLPCSWP